MKLKPIYFYLGIIVIVAVILIIYTKEPDTTPLPANHEMPQDDIHKGLGSGKGKPSGANVSSEVKMKLEQLKQTVEKNPDDTLAIREYAEFLSQAHKQDEAIDLYNKILKKDYKRTDIRFYLAIIYYHKQDFNKAEIILNEVLSYDKNNAQAIFNLGAVAATKGENDLAKKYWNKVVKENPNSELATMAKEALKNIQ